MGVPKFFRYISERYPCLSEVVKEYQLPEFDNLYLDMNGIIHVCSHPNDIDPHFRITEEKIFRDIFHYIEILFRMIQPQKLFFMAVDGVAPRAKMNQQRGRRFRSAKEAEDAEERARLKGEELPTAERFDSNCITPGTEFMTRLQEQLKYFVVFKISTDKLWQKVKVILSGHEVPGEGEHKIMDYIRYMRSQPGYDPTTRHCLYGLDADLIMLGLCTHEPHFSLLREEVKYGKKNNQKRIPTPEEQTFFLLHLSLMRDYLDLEFQQLKTSLTFPYNLESIIDDWVLMGFLVGNDFIPHLPDMHINKGALPILYKTYIDVLPTLGGYINEGGTLHLGRFQRYMGKLSEYDLEQFKEFNADLRFMESKTGRRVGGNVRHSYKNEEPPKNKELAALIASTEEDLKTIELSEDDSDSDYTDINTDDEDDDSTTLIEFRNHKKNYYIEKLEYDQVTPEVLRSQGEGYIRAIQWNLNYYYNGCCSWSWYYPHHYAPYISDIKNFANLKLEYEMATPFLPFQQLLAVLPVASKKLLPQAYHELMENDKSPIISFYPKEFKTDLNGKKQDWEAVVLIPFIDQDSLLGAMNTKEHLLSDEEKSRNKHGPMEIFTYTPKNMGSFVAPKYFPSVANHHAHIDQVFREELRVENSQLIKGLYPGVRLDVYQPGFPTLRHIPFNAELKTSKVKVFESPSQGMNMILTLLPQGEPQVSEVASDLLGKSIFVNWPHLKEARVVSITSKNWKFSWSPEDGARKEEMNPTMVEQWQLSKRGIEDRYFKQMGVEVGRIDIIVHACTLEDVKLVMINEQAQYEKQWSRHQVPYALQTTTNNIEVYDPRPEVQLSLAQLFPSGTTVFLLDPHHYGVQATVTELTKNQRIKVNCGIESEPNLDRLKAEQKEKRHSYVPGNVISQSLGISAHLLSRITGTIFLKTIEMQDKDRKMNIGLNLKFKTRNEEVCGYTRLDRNGYWLYSVKAEKEVEEYKTEFPEVFSFLEMNGGSDVQAEELYPKDTAEKLAQLQTWLKERPSYKTERQRCGAIVAEEEDVALIENLIENYIQTITVSQLSFNAKPTALYLPKPKLGQAPDLKANHQLYDRIVNVRESHTVPLGAKGTIIGIHDLDKGPQAMYEVVFDKEFPGGLKLRCSSNRGYRLPAQAFINLSYGQAVLRVQNRSTAVVFPFGTEEENGFLLNNNGHNSAFASWHNKNNHNQGFYSGVRSEESWQRRSSDQPLRPAEHYGTRQFTPNNSCHHSAPQQLSNEYLAMFNQLQKSGHNTKEHMNTKAPAHTLVDSSNTLKKMLKIADNGTKKLRLSPDNRNVPQPQSYCVRLFVMHQGLGWRLPRYLYSDTDDGFIVCTVVCGNGAEFQGNPAFDNDPAAESAAQVALQRLEAGPGFHQTRAPHTPGRMPFGQSPNWKEREPAGWRERDAGSGNWRELEPAQPSTLPQPPINWYQSKGRSNFLPDWSFSGVNRGPSFNIPSLPSPQQKPQFYPHHQFSQHGPQSYYSPPAQYYQGNPFIPLQAVRHQQQARPREPPQATPARTPAPAVSSESKAGRSRVSSGAEQAPARQQRSRIAANFSKPLSFTPPSGPK